MSKILLILLVSLTAFSDEEDPSTSPYEPKVNYDEWRDKIRDVYEPDPEPGYDSKGRKYTVRIEYGAESIRVWQDYERR